MCGSWVSSSIAVVRYYTPWRVTPLTSALERSARLRGVAAEVGSRMSPREVETRPPVTLQPRAQWADQVAPDRWLAEDGHSAQPAHGGGGMRAGHARGTPIRSAAGDEGIRRRERAVGAHCA